METATTAAVAARVAYVSASTGMCMIVMGGGPTVDHHRHTKSTNMSGSEQWEDGEGCITLYYGGPCKTTFYVPSKYGWGVEGRERLLARHATADPPTFALLFGGPLEKKDAFREHIVRITDQWKRENEGCYAYLE